MSAAAETSAAKGQSQAVWEGVRGAQRGSCRELVHAESKDERGAKRTKKLGNREELYRSKICYEP